MTTSNSIKVKALRSFQFLKRCEVRSCKEFCFTLEKAITSHCNNLPHFLTANIKKLILKLMPQDENNQKGVKDSNWVAVDTPDQTPQDLNIPKVATDKRPTAIANVASKLKIGIQKFPAMPVAQNDPNLPKLTTQSPPTNLPPSPPIPKPKGSPFKFLSIFSLIFNAATLFLVIIIVIFLISSGLILAYTNYTVYTPPKLVRDFLSTLIVKTPLPDKVESLPVINFKK